MTQYYSNTKQDYVNINDMHHQHVWYAFKKLCDRLEELKLSKIIWTESMVLAETYEILFDKCEQLKKNANSRMVLKLERQLSRLKEQIHRVQKHIGHRYTFSNIPNDDNGRSLVKAMRFYLNKDTYTMRVRGQYLDKSKLEKGESWKTYDDGQPLSKSKCIRLYIDKKKGK